MTPRRFRLQEPRGRDAASIDQLSEKNMVHGNELATSFAFTKFFAQLAHTNCCPIAVVTKNA